MEFNNVFLNKIKIFISLYMTNDGVFDNIPISEVLFLIAIIFIVEILSIFYGKKIDFKWNMYAILSFTFCYGVSARILSSIFTFMFGYLIFRCLYLEIRLKQLYLFALFLVVIFQVKSIFFNALYFRNYPLASFIPMYYIPNLMKESDYIERDLLPYRKNLELINRIEDI